MPAARTQAMHTLSLNCSNAVRDHMAQPATKVWRQLRLLQPRMHLHAAVPWSSRQLLPCRELALVQEGGAKLSVLSPPQFFKYLERILTRPPVPGVEAAAAQLLLDWSFLFG